MGRLWTWKEELRMVGLPMAGIGTLFYVVLMVGAGAGKLWRWGRESIQRIGKTRLRAREQTAV